MRLHNRIVLLEAQGATHRRISTPPDLDSAWNAAISNYLNTLQQLIINYLEVVLHHPFCVRPSQQGG